MKKVIVLTFLVVLVVVVGWILRLAFSDSDDDVRNLPKITVKPRRTQVLAAQTNRVVKLSKLRDRMRDRKNGNKDKGAKRRRSVTVVEYSPEDQKLVDHVRGALDDDSYPGVVTASEAAMKSANAEVRGEAVDALGWFGEKALVPLTKAMMDKDSDVAENARGQVETALMGMENAGAAFDYAASYVVAFNGDEEAIGMFEGVMTSSANQLVDPEDADSEASVKKACDNRAKIVETLVKMMEQGGALDKSAKSAYEDITGEAWTNLEDAEKWVGEPLAQHAEESKTSSDTDEPQADM